VATHGGSKIAAVARAATKGLRDAEAGRRVQNLGDAVPLDQLKEVTA